MEVVRCENLEKSYPVGLKGWRRIHDVWKPNQSRPRQVALAGVSFSLNTGETLGVLGVNGAGKSTLLKLIAGVTAPTAGSVTTSGRIGAILELGAGFLGEYTGRQNARMSLSLSGLRGQALSEAVEQARDFAGIGDFFDQPVRVYSSGMFVRLAFACATAVQPDLLLVDEALSVGDLFFQAKCVQKMKDMLGNGTALLFVSHDLSAVKSVCERCILLNGGRMEMIGPSDEVTERYYQMRAAAPQQDRPDGEENPEGGTAGERPAGDGRAVFRSARLLDSAGRACESLRFGETATLEIELECKTDLPALAVGYHVQDGAGVDAVYCDTAIAGESITDLHAGERVKITWRFEALLNEGAHNIALSASVPVDLEKGMADLLCRSPRAVQFWVERRPQAKLHGLTTWKSEVSVCRSR